MRKEVLARGEVVLCFISFRCFFFFFFQIIIRIVRLFVVSILLYILGETEQQPLFDHCSLVEKARDYEWKLQPIVWVCSKP